MKFELAYIVCVFFSVFTSYVNHTPEEKSLLIVQSLPANNREVLIAFLKPMEVHKFKQHRVYKFASNRDTLELEITLEDSSLKNLKLNKQAVVSDDLVGLLPELDSIILYRYKGKNYIGIQFKDFFIDYGSSKVRSLPTMIFKFNDLISGKDWDCIILDEESIPSKQEIINDINSDSVLDFSEYKTVENVNDDSLELYRLRYPTIYVEDFYQIRFKTFISGAYILNSVNKVLFYDVAFMRDSLIILSSNK